MDGGCIQDCSYHRHWEIFLIKSRVAAKALGVWVDSCLWISNWRSTCCRSVEALEEEPWILSKRENHIGDHGLNPLVFELIAAQRIKGSWNVSDFINHYPIAVTASNCMKLLILCEFTFMKHEILIWSWQKLDRMRVTNLRVTDAHPKSVQVNYWQCGYMKSLDKKIPLFTKHISFQNSKFLACLSSWWQCANMIQQLPDIFPGSLLYLQDYERPPPIMLSSNVVDRQAVQLNSTR